MKKEERMAQKGAVMVDAVVKNGVIEETASESSIKKAATKNGMDKDAFLQL